MHLASFLHGLPFAVHGFTCENQFSSVRIYILRHFEEMTLDGGFTYGHVAVFTRVSASTQTGKVSNAGFVFTHSSLRAGIVTTIGFFFLAIYSAVTYTIREFVRLCSLEITKAKIVNIYRFLR
jgi:hypothetical protein